MTPQPTPSPTADAAHATPSKEAVNAFRAVHPLYASFANDGNPASIQIINDHALLIDEAFSSLRAELAQAKERVRGIEERDRSLREAASLVMHRYLSLVNSGDAGNWDPEKEPEVIALRTALARKDGPK